MGFESKEKKVDQLWELMKEIFKKSDNKKLENKLVQFPIVKTKVMP